MKKRSKGQKGNAVRDATLLIMTSTHLCWRRHFWHRTSSTKRNMMLISNKINFQGKKLNFISK